MKSRLLLIAFSLWVTSAFGALTNSDKAELGAARNYIENGGIERGKAGFATYMDGQTFTVTIAAPGVFTVGSAHGMAVGDSMRLETTGSLPTGLATATTYYISSVPSSTTFQLSATLGGSSITTTGSQSGTHTLRTFKPSRGATGGTASHLTLASSASSPLKGARSLTIANSGSTSALSEGVSYSFSVDPVDRGGVLQVSFSYSLTTGTFVSGSVVGSTITDSDVEVYMYDTTNSTLIQPSSYVLTCGSVVSTICNYTASFQTASTTASMRMALHVATVNTSAWTLKLDDFSVSRVTRVYGSPITDLKSCGTIGFSCSGGACTAGTTSINRVMCARVGNKLKLKYEFKQTVAGTTSTGVLLLALPSGYTADTTLINNDATTNGSGAVAADATAAAASMGGGGWIVDATNSSRGVLTPKLYDSTHITAEITYNGSSISNWPASSTWSLGATTLGFSLEAEVPIAGWNSNVQMSDQAPVGLIVAKYRNTTNFTTTTSIPVNYDTQVFDYGGLCSPSATAFKCTAPVSGVYRIQGGFGSAASSGDLYLYKNGVSYEKVLTWSVANYTQTFSSSVFLNAGDYVDLRAAVSSATNGATTGTNHLHFERVSGPSAVAANETIAAGYYVSAAFAASSTVPVNYDSKLIDTHSAVTTSSTAWKFTAPAAGLYEVTGYAGLSNTVVAYVFKNGTAYAPFGRNNGSFITWGAVLVRLNAGDYIDVRPSGASTFDGGSLATASVSTVNIKRVGL
jgi:hypothetical protein